MTNQRWVLEFRLRRALHYSAVVAALLLAGGCSVAKVESEGAVAPPPPPDSVAPTVTAFAASGTSSPVTVTTFTATDNVGVTGYAITQSATPPSASASVWQRQAPALYGTPSSGAVTLYPWARDAAGNVSPAYTSPIQLTLTPPVGRPTLGTNLTWMVDWDPEKLPADLVWSARPWALGAGNGAVGADTWASIDTQGWPIVPVGTTFGSVFEGSPWPGVYKLSFRNRQGTTGDTVASYSGNITLTNRQHDAGTNITTYDVTVPTFANQFIWLRWAGSTGGITDVHLMRPLKDGSGWHTIGTPLADYIVDRLRWFTTLRVAQTQSGESGKVSGRDTVWSDRTAPWGPQTRSRGSPGRFGGLAIENSVAIANQTQKDLWIEVPFLANDDYITKMAQTIKCGSDGSNPWIVAGTSTCAAGTPTFAPLASSLNVYVEHGNEMWNSAGGYWEGENEAQASADVGAGDPYYLNAVVGTQAANDSGIPGWGWRRTGYLVVRHSLIFRSVFGDPAMMTRVRPVLATQHGRYGTTLHPLRYVESIWGPSSPYGTVGGYSNPRQPVSYYVYALATAPYTFNGAGADASSPAALLDATITDLNISAAGGIQPAMTFNVGTASARGIRYVTYEGGDGLIPELFSGGRTVGNVTNAILASFDATQGARMGAHIDGMSGLPTADQSNTVYGKLLSEWAIRGGDLFMHYTLGEAADGGSMFGLCAPTNSSAITVTGWSSSMGTSSSDCRFEYGPKWDAIKAFSAAWNP